MEIESLFSSTRWEIIQNLSRIKLSPMELAEKLHTTAANVSQQLRLLELAGLVKSEKTQNNEKGKPRIIYSLTGDSSFLILALPGFTDKKLLTLTPYNKFILKSMFAQSEHHQLIGEVYFSLKDQLNNIKVIAAHSARDLTLYLVSDNQNTLTSLKKIADEYKKIKIIVLDSLEFKKKSSEELLILHDPSRTYEVVRSG